MSAFQRIIFEKDAMKYKMADEILSKAKEEGIETTFLNSNRYISEKGQTKKDKYFYGKQTMIVGVRKTLKFQTCKPSAHYQLPLVSGCIGQCEYCYLNTQFSDRPSVYVYVNIEEILDQAAAHIQERGELTLFEGAATSDPLPSEVFTGALKRTIEFFGQSEFGRFRFVTKYTSVDDLLQLDHKDHTEIRLSVNIPSVIKAYEHKTPSLEKRIEAINKLIGAGYSVGLIIAPVILEENWKDHYGELLSILDQVLIRKEKVITFEIISHRFTSRAKNSILEIYENTQLPMREEDRKFKYGQFGYGKFIYTDTDMASMKAFFQEKLGEMGIAHKILYII